MPVTIVYVGPLRSAEDAEDAEGDVEIPDSEQWARAGVPIEVESDLAERLLEQTGNWARADGLPDTRATVASILADVGEDPEKAAAALVVEQARGDKARSTLVEQLEAITKKEQ